MARIVKLPPPTHHPNPLAGALSRGSHASAPAAIHPTKAEALSVEARSSRESTSHTPTLCCHLIVSHRPR